ncbi:MAG: trypsin-like peptidase domain-containing protein [Bacteroidales bacterium]
MSEISNISGSVFKINTSSGSGSGFYLKDRGIIVTNCHVILGYRNVALEDHKNNRYPARVVFVNKEADVAFLKPENEFDTYAVELADISNLKSRDKVFVLGFPFGMPYTETNGIVSAPRQLMEGSYYIQTDAAVNPGNSGGPVVDENGRVVGITTCKFTQADNMGFAVPVDILKEELFTFAQNQTMLYSVKCNSCKSLITEEVEYCPNCGNSIDAKLFEKVSPSKIEEYVESAMVQIGMDPVMTRTGYEFWEFHRGSALVRVFVFSKNYLYATSPINNLPTTNLENLFKYLLSNPISPYQLGIYQNQIFISYRAHLSDVFSSAADKIKENIAHLLLKADEMDDFFEREFGCPKSNFAKKE